MASLSQAHLGPHDGVDVLGDHVEEFGEVGDEHIYHLVLKRGDVQLHVHCADHDLEGHPSHASYEARAPKSPPVYSYRPGVESCGLQL